MRLVLLYILIKKCRRVDENQWQQRLGRRLLVKAITVDQFAFSSRLDVGLTPKHLIHMSSSSYSRVVDLFPSRLLLARRPQSWNNNVAHSRTGKLYEDSSAFHKFSSLGPHPHTLPSAAPEVFGSAKNLEKASPDCKKTLSPLFGNRSEGIRAPLAGYVALPLDQQNEDFDVQREWGEKILLSSLDQRRRRLEFKHDRRGGAGVVLLYRAPPKWTRSWRNISKRREKSRIHLYSGCAPSKKEEEAAAFISLADRGDINTSRQKRRVGDGEKEFPPLSLYLLCVPICAIT